MAVYGVVLVAAIMPVFPAGTYRRGPLLYCMIRDLRVAKHLQWYIKKGSTKGLKEWAGRAEGWL